MPSSKPDRIEIVEIGPCDGLAALPRPIPASRRVALIDALSRCGFRRIEAAAFLAQQDAPQGAEAREIMAGIVRAPGVRYVAQISDPEGCARAKAAGADAVALRVSASEGFSRASFGAPIAESLALARAVARAAKADGMALRGQLACVIACPHDGPTPPAQVARMVGALLEMGCHEVSLVDDAAAGSPETVRAMLFGAQGAAPPEMLAGRFGDAGGRALANIEAAMDLGLRVFDAAVGGLGASPFAPGAPGFVATGALAARMEKLGVATGLDMAALARAATLAISIREDQEEEDEG